MPNWKDKLKGGRADKRKPSDFNKKALEAGRKHEMEHTSDPHKAEEIAMDHLEEDPLYYEKLKKIEVREMNKKNECGSWETAQKMTSPEENIEINGPAHIDMSPHSHGNDEYEVENGEENLPQMKPSKVLTAPLKFEKNESTFYKLSRMLKEAGQMNLPGIPGSDRPSQSDLIKKLESELQKLESQKKDPNQTEFIFPDEIEKQQYTSGEIADVLRTIKEKYMQGDKHYKFNKIKLIQKVRIGTDAKDPSNPDSSVLPLNKIKAVGSGVGGDKIVDQTLSINEIDQIISDIKNIEKIAKSRKAVKSGSNEENIRIQALQFMTKKVWQIQFQGSSNESVTSYTGVYIPPLVEMFIHEADWRQKNLDLGDRSSFKPGVDSYTKSRAKSQASRMRGKQTRLAAKYDKNNPMPRKQMELPGMPDRDLGSMFGNKSQKANFNKQNDGRPELSSVAGKYMHVNQESPETVRSIYSGHTYETLPSRQLGRIDSDEKAQWGSGTYKIEPDGKFTLVQSNWDSSD